MLAGGFLHLGFHTHGRCMGQGCRGACGLGVGLSAGAGQRVLPQPSCPLLTPSAALPLLPLGPFPCAVSSPRAVPCCVMCCGPQALVLLLFNDSDELSAASIKEALGVDDDKELARTLLSLSVGKVRGDARGVVSEGLGVLVLRVRAASQLWQQCCACTTVVEPRRSHIPMPMWLCCSCTACTHVSHCSLHDDHTVAASDSCRYHCVHLTPPPLYSPPSLTPPPYPPPRLVCWSSPPRAPRSPPQTPSPTTQPSPTHCSASRSTTSSSRRRQRRTQRQTQRCGCARGGGGLWYPLGCGTGTVCSSVVQLLLSTPGRQQSLRVRPVGPTPNPIATLNNTPAVTPLPPPHTRLPGCPGAPARDRRRHRACDEDAQDARTQAAGAGGHDAAALPAHKRRPQATHRQPHRARVPGAIRKRQPGVQLPRVM